MAEFKIVLSTKDGKSVQKDVKSPEADGLMKKKIGETLQGDSLGFAGYELQVTGGSDKSGFPMRKGIQKRRLKVLIKGGTGFSGKKRDKTNQKGLKRKKTVCGEVIDDNIVQINLKVLKKGSAPLAAQEMPAAETANE